MCGIAGLASTPSASIASHLDVVRRMSARMRSRGPDAQGEWAGEGVVLSHRRLAIVDLDVRANQPMQSRRRSLPHRLQRGDLQLSRVASGAGTRGRCLPNNLRYGSASRAVRARAGDVCCRGCAACSRLPSGTRRAGALHGARSLRHQAALLCADRRWTALRIPGQSAARVDARVLRARAGGMGWVPSLGQRTGAMDLFPRRARAAGGPLDARAIRSSRGRQSVGTTSASIGKRADARCPTSRFATGCGRR